MSQLFYPADAHVPAELRIEGFFIRMLTALDVDLDYDAVISNRDALLIGSGGRWPRDGFTRAENLADLQGHERDHAARSSFTYTVMNTAGTRCHGCIYINPLDETPRRLGFSTGDIGSAEASVTFWLRPEDVATDRDRALLNSLMAWLGDSWAFSRVTFMANENQHREIEIYRAAGLRKLYTLDRSPGRLAHFVYG